MLEENLTSKYFYSLEINSVFNNKGFGDSTSKGSFTVVGSYYPIEHRPPDNFTYKEVPYKFKGIGEGLDNFEMEGQEIRFVSDCYTKINFLGSATNGDFYESVSLLKDGAIVGREKVYFTDFIAEKPMFNNSLVKEFAYVRTRSGILEQLQPKIWQTSIDVPSGIEFDSMKFGDNPSIHIFSITMEKNNQ